MTVGRRGAGAAVQLQPLKAGEKEKAALHTSVPGSPSRAGWAPQSELTGRTFPASQFLCLCIVAEYWRLAFVSRVWLQLYLFLPFPHMHLFVRVGKECGSFTRSRSFAYASQLKPNYEKYLPLIFFPYICFVWYVNKLGKRNEPKTPL